MSTELETNLNSILTEKTTKIIPENIKSGVTILGVNGSLTPGVEINEIVEQYQVATGQNISAGDFVGFIENYGTTVGTKADIDNTYASGKTISAVKLDNNKVFVAYSKSDSYYYLNAVVLTINGTTITTGTSIQLSSERQSGQGISTVKYDNENVYIFHCNTTNRRLYCMHVTIDGTTITKDYDTELNSTNYSGMYISAVKLSKNYIFIAHSYTSSYHLYASTIKINNDYSFTTCNNGTLLVSSMGYYISTTKSDENSVIIAHCSDTNQTPLKIIKVSINNTATTITTNISDYAVSSATGVGRNSQIIKLKNDRIVILYGNNDAQQLTCALYSVTSSFSRLMYSQISSSTNSGTGIMAFKIDENTIKVYAGSQYMYGYTIKINDNNLDYDQDMNTITDTMYTLYSKKYYTNLKANENTLLLLFGDSNSVSAHLSGIAIQNTTTAFPITNYSERIRGVAKASGTSGETINIAVPGIY